nr:hypothetical protein [Tanacetum cinerariifolium]
MPFIKEGGPVLKIPRFKSFVIPEGQLSNEDVMAQLSNEDVMAQVKEMKRLADLKAEKKKSEKSLKKILNPTTIRAQAQKMVEFKSKRKKMLDEYNHQISYRERKRTSKILYEMFMKENIVVDGLQRNLIPPPGIEGSRGRVIREPESGIFYYNGNFDLVFQREEEFHLATTAQLIRLHGAIQRGNPEAEEMFKKKEMIIEARNDANQARKIVQDNLDGLGEYMLLEEPDLEHFCWTRSNKFFLETDLANFGHFIKVFETHQNVKQEIRDQLNAEAEAVQIILTRIDNDIYSIVDACPNACEMWKAIERLKQGESINVQDLETNLFWECGKFTSLDGESLESYYSRDCQKPKRAKDAAYEGQRSGTVAGARETVGSSMVQKSG